jgi:hypothetical protein
LVPGTGRCEDRPVPLGFSAAALSGLDAALARRARAAAPLLPLPAHLLGEAADLLFGGRRREVVDGGRDRRLRLGALVGLHAGDVVEVLVQLLDGLGPGQVARHVRELPDLAARAVRDQGVDQRLHEPLDAVVDVLGDHAALALRRDLDGRVAHDDVHDRFAAQVQIDDLERLADARSHYHLVEVGEVEARRAPLVLARRLRVLGYCHGGAHVELLSGPIGPSFEAFP